MASADLEQFLEKIRQLNAFVALSERDPTLREALRQCDHHNDVVALARRHGFEIGRRWGEAAPPPGGPATLLCGVAPPSGEERVEVLVQADRWRLERIHSCQASSPPGDWYEQPEHEWVCLLQGHATLEFADEEWPVHLQTGHWLLITPFRRHRVVATDPAPGTIWLALFWWQDPLN
jgi:cupin 2 domain-containing protein